MLQRSVCSLLSAAVMAAAFCATPTQTFAQAETPAQAAVDPKLTNLADDFLHYSLINNAGLAQASGEALLAPAVSPRDVLVAFETGARGRDVRAVLAQAQRREDLKDTATKLLEKMEEGFRGIARDPQRIRAEVDRLAGGPRAYQNSKDRLMAAGQFAAPIFIEYLQKADKKDLHPFILRVMGEIGRPLLLPLIEELRISDPILRVQIINVIAQIGYPQALPALRALATDSASPAETKTAAENAIRRIDQTGQAGRMAAAELFLLGGQNYYDRKASYQPLLLDEKTNPIWVFDQGLNNVSAVQVPTPIWNNIMAMRMAESALKGNPEDGNAISLWLAANLRREIQLPQGAADPMKPANMPEASFYARAAGPKYVNPVLAKALDANDAALALRAIDALQATGGVESLVTDNESPIVRALSHSNRAVRFNAAFALADANPKTQFPSYFRVIPVLAEAINSTSSPTALLVVENEDTRNSMTDLLRGSDARFVVSAGATLSGALESARRAPAIDVVIVPSTLNLDSLADLARSDYRLTGVPVLVTAPAENVSTVSVQLDRAGRKGYVAIDQKADAANMAAGYQRARTEIGSVAMDAQAASQFALTSLGLLNELAGDHRTIYAVNEAVPTLIEALRDSRAEIATASAQVLGKLNSPEGQKALAPLGIAADTAVPLRVVFLEQLAESAKRTGNVLDSSVINSLIRVVSSDSDPKVRVAAATALGALNVPSNQASDLIRQQMR